MNKLKEKDNKINELRSELEQYKLNYKIVNSILDSPNHYSNTRLIRSGAKKQWQLNNSKSLLMNFENLNQSPEQNEQMKNNLRTLSKLRSYGSLEIQKNHTMDSIKIAEFSCNNDEELSFNTTNRKQIFHNAALEQTPDINMFNRTEPQVKQIQLNLSDLESIQESQTLSSRPMKTAVIKLSELIKQSEVTEDVIQNKFRTQRIKNNQLKQQKIESAGMQKLHPQSSITHLRQDQHNINMLSFQSPQRIQTKFHQRQLNSTISNLEKQFDSHKDKSFVQKGLSSRLLQKETFGSNQRKVQKKKLIVLKTTRDNQVSQSSSICSPQVRQVNMNTYRQHENTGQFASPKVPTSQSVTSKLTNNMNRKFTRNQMK